MYSEGTSQVELREVLVFFTGADSIPPTGFPFQGTLEFIYNETRKLAMASTFSGYQHVILPTTHSLTLSFCGHGGFGLI